MKTKILALAAMGLAACSSTPRPAAVRPAEEEEWVDPSGREEPPRDMHTEVETLLNAFERAVSRHDKKRVIGYLDPNYRDKEFDDLYQGDIDTFLNDFFCGGVVDGGEIHCLVFDEITSISREKIEYGKLVIWAHYTLQSTQFEIRTKLRVKVKTTVTYGLIGSRGYTQVE